MSLVLRFNLLRNNIWSSYPVRFLKQLAGFSYEKLLQPGNYEKRHFTTKLTETASWHKTDSASCIPAISPLWLRQTSEHDQPATILVFDIETTGFLHADHRIIEFALRDLSGGMNCTFETLINPERNVPRYAAEANNITTELVCRPDVPRFSDLLPILLAYVQSRQAPGKPVLWVAHNAKQFDVPFVIQEFERCSAQVPADWLFVDSLCLARKLKKSDGNIGLLNLKALGEHYGVSSEGPSHRAMPDVQALCDILPKITLGLKLTCDGLMSEARKFYDFRKVSRM
ncbi:hypothetical protein PAHAL_7G296300 [Panicum hallii]|uniref:Exonuclease domain-containing protein n=1 Tax=Panicum hallii TaxID=206008 RepID=A0A2S3IAH0_9POAL|nr:exonuclease DPD1, chloroplastic/mitochondrial [Panicum hallii]PAN40162.1 hypothetical protein PAHAL_7G296300 [Panicum hallii]PAN40163.1 hypothetical protein PAHAL_7G296300 [Panicum hallii]